MRESPVDFIGIGCRRSGTSFLHQCLNAHPGVAKPERGLHFFSTEFGNGPDWYGKRMTEAGESACRVELSVSYMYPDYAAIVPSRISSVAPHAKLFVCLRDPVSRAHSDFLRSNRNLEINPELTFQAALRNHPEFLERGRYRRLLEPFVSEFGRERLLVLLYDDLEQDPHAFLGRLFGYLGVERDAIALPKTVRSKGRRVAHPRLEASLQKSKDALDSVAAGLGISTGWGRLKRSFVGPYRKLRRLNTTRETIAEETNRELHEYYREDIEWVREVTGRHLWSART